MKYEIEVEETIKKINTIIIEVEDEEEGEFVAQRLYDEARDGMFFDDLICEAGKYAEVTDVCHGAEEVELEVL